MTINEVRYTELARFLARHVAFKSGATDSDPLHQYGMCIACRRSAGHDTDCLAARARVILYSVRFVAQFLVNDRTTTVFSVMGKRNLENGTLFMYSVHAVVTNNSLQPHTTCSCGHCSPTNLCDHARQVGAALIIVGRVMKLKDSVIVKNAPEPERAAEDPRVTEFGADMPEMPPSSDEELGPERIAALQKIVGGERTNKMPFDPITGECGKCGGVWGHAMECEWK